MFDWLKRKPRDETPPWSQILNARQERRFDELVNAHLAARGETARAVGGVVTLNGSTCGLDNLAQLCHANPPDDWPRLIAEHFDAFERSERESEEWHARKSDFAWVAPQLCVRLHVEDFTGANGEPVAIADLSLVRDDLPGLATVLVADRPSSIMTVEREVCATWGRTADELFAVALVNLARQHPVTVEPIDLDEEAGIRAFLLQGEHLFVASHALRLDAWPELVGAHGTLFAVPTRDTVLAYPIESAAVTQSLRAMSWFAYRFCADGPGSILPHLYWRTRDGRFAVMTVAVEENSVALKPSEEFVELMNALTG